MSEQSFDEVTTDATRAMRMAVMLGSQTAERMARLRADRQREAADATRERAAQLREDLTTARDAARAAYEPVADPRRFAHADVETAAAAWTTAAAWAETDPRAAAAEASLAQQIRQRWGVDPQELRESAKNQQRDEVSEETSTGPAEGDTDRAEGQEESDQWMNEAMDPEWRQEASTDELESRWQQANADLDRPGAAHARDALEATLAERMGLDLEKFRRQMEPDLAETIFNADGDRAATAADRAAEGSERTEQAGWENRASDERGREAAAGSDSGLEAEESVDAREAEGMAAQANSNAETDHAQANESRADVEAMNDAGVPPRSQQVRTTTARGFGSTPTAGAQAKRHRKGRKNTRGAGQANDQDLGR